MVNLRRYWERVGQVVRTEGNPGLTDSEHQTPNLDVTCAAARLQNRYRCPRALDAPRIAPTAVIGDMNDVAGVNDGRQFWCQQPAR